MKKILSIAVSTLFLALTYTGCSQEQMAAFQKNDQEPQYSLLNLFDSFPALHSAVESIDSQKLNDGLGDMMINGYETPEFLRDAVQLVQAPFLVPMINELHGVLKVMMDRTPVHYDDPTNDDGGYYDATNGSIDRLAQFYAALETVVDNTDLSADILDIATQVVDYLVDTKTPAEIEEDMGNMMKVRLYDNCMYDETSTSLYIDLSVGSYDSTALGAHSAVASSISIPIGVKVTLYDGTDFTGNSLELTSGDRCLTDNLVGAGPANWNDRARSIKIEYDLTKLAKLAGKVTMSCDYPMWVNGSGVPAANRDNANSGAYTTNTDLGNAVKGVIKLLYGLNTIAASDETVRNTIDAMILTDLPGLLNSDPDATTKIQNLIVNMSNYFAVDEIGISEYESNADYHNDDISTGYVNASFKETLRDMLPTLVKLFIRNDGSSAQDYSIINSDNQSPIEALMVSLNKLKAAGIDYSDTANALEPTLKRTMQYNGRMKDRSSHSLSSDSSWSQMSYLDHLVYTIGSAYYFGYLARVGSASGEGGYTNFNYGHGIPTNGIITVNDSMFALTSKDASAAIMGCSIGMDSYALALADRTGQADHISRSSSSFGYSNRGSHKFYLGYDYPTMLLLPSNCAGDAGIPNGGETAITVNQPTTESTTGGTNDYRTYWPKVADGKGVLNTSQFLMGWVARVAWDGQGPYYSTTYTNDATHPATTTYNMPVNGSQTVNVYYKPNGEVYAYVYKQSSSPSTWEYFYPNSLQTGIGNDIADPDDANGQRANRYKDVVVSDNYLIQHNGGGLLDGIWDSRYNVPPMNDNGSDYIQSGDKFRLKPIDPDDAGAPSAKPFKLWERIGEKQETSTGSGISVRECATQEEAIYRNIQWFLFEKKFAFIIPMWVDALSLNAGGAFIIIEANGAVGLANAKKGSANGRWIKLRSEGIPGTTYNPNYGNNPDYGDSNIPGDGRIIVLCRSVTLAIATINATFLFDNVLGSGYVLPDAVGRNIEPVARMAFLTEDAVDILSDDRTATWDTAWANRNKLAPVLVALAGTLHDGTKYVPSTSGTGYNYNYASPSPHKYPLADLLEGVLMPLGKPMFRRFNTADTGSSPRWVPRVKDESGATFAYLRPNVTGYGYTPTVKNYIPRDTLRTPLSVLVGNSIDSYDGVMPMMADGGGMVTRLLGLLQLLGGEEFAEPRANIALGLEQVMTAAKFNKSEAITNNYFTTLDFSKYEWMFNKRAEDLDLEDFLGYEGEYRTTADGGDWETFEDMVDMMKSFMGGSRDIRQNLVNIVNAVLAQQLTEDEVHGLLYTVGKLFAKYNQTYPGGAWLYHGYDHGAGQPDNYDQLVDMLTYLPQVHDVMKSSDGSGVKYNRLLKNVDILMKDQTSLVHTLLEGMSTPYTAGDVIEDLDRFLGWSIISDPNSPLWDDLSLMLDAMADMNDPRVDINAIIKNLGFQAN